MAVMTVTYNDTIHQILFDVSGIYGQFDMTLSWNGGTRDLGYYTAPYGEYSDYIDVSSLAPGTYTLTADDGGGTTASASFTIGGGPYNLNPQMVILNNQLNPGESLAIQLTGFYPNSPLNVSVVNHQNFVTVTTDATGAASANIQLPSDITGGTWELVAIDNDASHASAYYQSNLATANFTVLAGAAQPPVISPDYLTITAGTDTVSFALAGFMPNSHVDISCTAWDLNVGTLGTDVDSTGALQVTIPNRIYDSTQNTGVAAPFNTPGSYMIYVNGYDVNNNYVQADAVLVVTGGGGGGGTVTAGQLIYKHQGDPMRIYLNFTYKGPGNWADVLKIHLYQYTALVLDRINGYEPSKQITVTPAYADPTVLQAYIDIVLPNRTGGFGIEAVLGNQTTLCDVPGHTGVVIIS